MSHHGKHGYPITKQMKLERRKEAEARQVEYDKLSLEEKLANLPPDGAKRQRARLEAMLSQKTNTVSLEELPVEKAQLMEEKKPYQKPSKQKKR